MLSYHPDVEMGGAMILGLFKSYRDFCRRSQMEWSYKFSAFPVRSIAGEMIEGHTWRRIINGEKQYKPATEEDYAEEIGSRQF